MKGDTSDGTQRRRGQLLATLLTGLAGMVDAIGFIRLQHLFVSYTSGNTTQFAVSIGRGQFDAAGQIGPDRAVRRRRRRWAVARSCDQA
jgi:hypothetical protein